MNISMPLVLSLSLASAAYSQVHTGSGGGWKPGDPVVNRFCTAAERNDGWYDGEYCHDYREERVCWRECYKPAARTGLAGVEPNGSPNNEPNGSPKSEPNGSPNNEPNGSPGVDQ